MISKETPLHDPAKVFAAAIAAARVPGRTGSAIDEIAGDLQTDSAAYAELYRWVHHDGAPVDSRFAASLFLYEYARGDAEFADRIVRFWAGDPLPLADLRRRLKEAGAAATYGWPRPRSATSPSSASGSSPGSSPRPATGDGSCCSTRSS